MLLAIGCISSIVAILFYMNGKTLLDWKLPIQPNSLVAIFSTVGKSALLFAVSEGLGQLKWLYFEEPRALSQMENFDQASRGPWGAFTFLWHTRGTAILASMGAFATVLMLAFEPITQQVIEFSTRVSIQSNQTGWYSTAYSWSDSRLNDTHNLPSSSYADYPLKMSLLGVMSEQSVTSQDNYYCPASECRFPDFNSLALCSNCEIEPAVINMSSTCTYGVANKFGSYQIITDLEAYIQNASSQSNLNVYMQIRCTNEKVPYPSLVVETRVSLVDPSWINQPDGRTTVNNIDYLTISVSDDIDGVTTYMVKADNVTATNTTLQYVQGCINHYPRNTPYNSTTTVTTYTCFNLTSDIGVYADLSRLGEVNGTITRCELEMCAQTYKQPVSKNNHFYPGEVVDIPLETIGNWTTTEGPHDPRFGFGYGGNGIDLLGRQLASVTGTDDYSNLKTYDSGLVQILNGNFTEVFRRLAAACSVVMQSPKNPETKRIVGTAYAPETYVKVRWVWLIMPLSVVLISTIFMVHTVIRSWKTPYLYKTSTLATLFHGLEVAAFEDYETKFKEHERELDNDMFKIAKKMRVRLGPNRDGWLKLKKE